MKTVILCGGLGTRLAEETSIRPKPMVEVGGKPILCHIMDIYSNYDVNDFVLALGYKGEFIKDYFLNYNSRRSDFIIDIKSGKIKFSEPDTKNWKIQLIDTGKLTLTGGRLLRLKETLSDDESFMLTYGDGVSDVNIKELITFHKSHGKIATVTAVRPPARFGGMKIEKGQVVNFKEKPQGGEGWINGGFFVFNKEIFNYLENDKTILEQSPLENLSKDGELMAYNHHGYWQCMDTIRDRDNLRKLVDNNEAPWINSN
jgi:glucose-1-phosphate cytidylyltransferase